MPTDVDALLAYGYDLGGPGRWNLRGVDSDLKPDFSWWDWRSGDSFTRAVYDKLQRYRRTNADADVGRIEAVWYGSDTRYGIGIGYILCATHYSTYYSHAFPIAKFPDEQHYKSWDRQLQQAACALGLLPSLPPRWILAASHGI